MRDSSNTPARLTARAAEMVKVVCEGSPNPILHLYASSRTCCGMRFGLEIAETVEDGYTITESDGVRLIVDPASIPYCAGATVDYLETSDGAGFTVDSPLNTGGCGCGRR